MPASTDYQGNFFKIKANGTTMREILINQNQPRNNR